jgi:hypothetical protein
LCPGAKKDLENYVLGTSATQANKRDLELEARAKPNHQMEVCIQSFVF